MTERNLLQEFAAIDATEDAIPPAARHLVLQLLAATLRADSDTLNRLLNSAGRDELGWACARLANLVGALLAEKHGLDEAQNIISELLDEEGDR